MFSKKTNNQIEKTLKEKSKESIKIINLIEKLLSILQKNKFKIPPKGTPVILLFSGGIDSTTLLYLLVKKYQLEVYPIVNLSPDLGFNFNNKLLINKLIKPLKKDYPNLINDPYFIQHPLVSKEINSELIKYLNKNPNLLLNEKTHNGLIHREIPDMMTQYISPILQFADLLRIKRQKKVSDIFIGLISNDGDDIYSQTLTSIRTINLNTILSTGRKGINIIPYFIEKRIGNYYSKSDVIKIAKEMDIPLEHTWSCYQKGIYHCGQCLDCVVRKENFAKANVKDKTVYKVYENRINYIKYMIIEKFNYCKNFLEYVIIGLI